MKNTLQINAAVCDARKVTDETLSAHGDIQLNCAMLLTDARSRALLAQHPDIQLNCASIIDCEGDARIANGKLTLSGSDAVPEGQVLLVNGKLYIRPDAADTLRAYAKIKINGKVYCPEALAALVARLTEVNGKTVVYPNDAVALESSFRLDRGFALRAQNCLYWAEKQIAAVDEKLDCAALAARGARFASGKALIAESLAEALAPLFTADTKLEILPAGTRFVDDDLKLTSQTLRRYGSRIYVDGDVDIAPECAGRLGGLESLTVKGDITLPAALEDEFFAIPELEYDELKTYSGRLFSGMKEFNIDADLFGNCPEGITCMDCVHVTIDPNVEPETIKLSLVVSDCVSVTCTKYQCSAVAAVCSDVVSIELSDEQKPETDGGVQINAAEYVL